MVDESPSVLEAGNVGRLGDRCSRGSFNRSDLLYFSHVLGLEMG